MVTRAEAWRDLRYAGYIAGVAFIYLLFTYLGSQRLLAFWIAFLGALVVLIPSWLVIVGSRIVGRLTGLNKPVVQARDNVRDRIESIVEELDEEIEKSG